MLGMFTNKILIFDKECKMQKYKYQKELDLFNAATEAATVACQQMLLGENAGQWYPCGFSWVNIKPARGRFVAMLKDQKLGRLDTFEGGYVIYNPSNISTQWMDAKMAGSRAFANVLVEAGISARAVARID